MSKQNFPRSRTILVTIIFLTLIRRHISTGSRIRLSLLSLTFLINFLYFFTVCEKGYYGDDCKKKCGFCKNQTACNHVDGLCPKGCDPDYIGEFCIERKSRFSRREIIFIT